MIRKIKHYITIFITVLLWIIFIGQLKNVSLEMLKESAIFIVLIIIVIEVWRIYNIKRFSKLNRRKFPIDTSNDDVAECFKIDVDQIKMYQNKKIIVLETNIL